MKRSLIIFLLTPVAFFLHGQQVNFQWAIQAGGVGPADARGMSIVTDAPGNVYTTGFFTGRVDFDPGPQARQILIPDQPFTISFPARAFPIHLYPN